MRQELGGAIRPGIAAVRRGNAARVLPARAPRRRFRLPALNQRDMKLEYFSFFTSMRQYMQSIQGQHHTFLRDKIFQIRSHFSHPNLAYKYRLNQIPRFLNIL